MTQMVIISLIKNKASVRNKFNFRNILLRFKGLFSIGISDIIGSGISALFWLYVATLLEVESYGEIFYLLAIANMATTISLIGTKYAMPVYVPKNIKLESTIFLIVIISGSIASLITLLIFRNAGLSLYVFGGAIFILGTSEILAKKLYTDYLKYLLVHKALTVALAIGLYQWLGVEGIILGLAFAFFAYITIIIKTLKVIKIDFSLLRPRLGFLMNSYAMDMIVTSSRQIDKLIIAPLLGLAILANYQLGIQFISIFQLLPMIILKYTLPHDAAGNPNKNLKIATILVSFCFTILIILLAPLVIPIFFQKFTNVIEVTQILSLSLVPASVTTAYSSKFLGKENSKITLIDTLLLLVSYIVSILIIGTTFGVVGVAIAYVISLTIPTIFLIIVDLKNKISKS